MLLDLGKGLPAGNLAGGKAFQAATALGDVGEIQAVVCQLAMDAGGRFTQRQPGGEIVFGAEFPGDGLVQIRIASAEGNGSRPGDRFSAN